MISESHTEILPSGQDDVSIGILVQINIRGFDKPLTVNQEVSQNHYRHPEESKDLTRITYLKNHIANLSY